MKKDDYTNTPAIQLFGAAIEAVIVSLFVSWALRSYGVYKPYWGLLVLAFAIASAERFFSAWDTRHTSWSIMLRRTIQGAALLSWLALIAKWVGLL